MRLFFGQISKIFPHNIFLVKAFPPVEVHFLFITSKVLLCLNRHLCQKHSLGFLVVDHFSTTLTLSWFDAAGRYWYLLSLSVPPAAVAEAIVHLFTECYAEWSWGFGLWDLDKTCYSCFSQCSILRFWPTMNQYRSWVSDWTILTAVLIWVCGRFVCHTSCLFLQG